MAIVKKETDFKRIAQKRKGEEKVGVGVEE